MDELIWIILGLSLLVVFLVGVTQWSLIDIEVKIVELNKNFSCENASSLLANAEREHIKNKIIEKVFAECLK